MNNQNNQNKTNQVDQTDNNLLIDFFSIPTKPTKIRKKKSPTTRIEMGSRVAIIEKHGREWEGWFDDDHSTTYVAMTKRELIDDMITES